MHNLVNLRVPALQGKKEIVIGAKVSQREYEALQAICDREDRSMSYVVRELTMRGLAAYYANGQIRTTPDEDKVIARGPRKKGILATEIELDNKKRKSG